VASLQDIRRRIQSVKSTRQITSAMKLVAGAKLRRATENAQAARPYQEALTGVLGRLAKGAEDSEQPLLQRHDSQEKIELVVFSSDRGLCGGFNSNLLRDVERRVAEYREQGREVRLRCFGRKCRDHLVKRDYDVIDSVIELNATEFQAAARELSVQLRSAYEQESCDEVVVVFNRFVSVMTQRPVAFQLLPVQLHASGEEEQELAGASVDYLYEPDGESILGNLLPLYVETVLLQALLETEAGEHAARMTAMDSATRNASEIIGNLTLAYNRARQAAITTELIEIVSGAEAL